MTIIDDLHDRFPELDDERLTGADRRRFLAKLGVTEEVIADYLAARRGAGSMEREAYRSYQRGVESR